MFRKAAAGLAGLGLIGGAGSVIYNNSGDATVKIKDPNTGRVQTVHLSGGGAAYSCPDATSHQLEAYDVRLGRIKLTLQRVRSAERAIEHQYPGHHAPARVIARYRALGQRDDRLVSAFNAEVDARNGMLESDCTSG